jgi:hypothetical protein
MFNEVEKVRQSRYESTIRNYSPSQIKQLGDEGSSFLRQLQD